MSKFHSVNTIEVYEINGVEPESGKLTKLPTMQIYEHWNRKALITIAIEGKSYTVLADHIIRAINNAQNSHP